MRSLNEEMVVFNFENLSLNVRFFRCIVKELVRFHHSLKEKDMFRLCLVLITCTLMTASVAGGSSSLYQEDDHHAKFDPTRDAEKDIQAAVTLAAQTGRRVLLDVGGEWCSWCHKLDKFFEENKDVTEFMNEHYVVVKVNYSKENKNEKVLSQYPEIKGYPHLFVLENDGSLLHSQDTGELEAGKYHDRDKVFAFLKEWAPK